MSILSKKPSAKDRVDQLSCFEKGTRVDSTLVKKVKKARRTNDQGTEPDKGETSGIFEPEDTYTDLVKYFRE